MKDYLIAPFPWFGGKSRVAQLVWRRFGKVQHYIEPFAGSLAVLLGRPAVEGLETVNDKDCFVSNFWRALKSDPKAVAKHADWPVNEADLVARHRWLKKQTEFRKKLLEDPEYYDAKIAGWWVWGISCWIGNGWASAGGVSMKKPYLNFGVGINRKRLDVEFYFAKLADRLRQVRVACGDWSRVLGAKSLFDTIQPTGVFFDPPYDQAERNRDIYSVDTAGLSKDVREWAIEHGDDPRIRIALCGYEGEHKMPKNWQCVPWFAPGGYASLGNGRGKENAKRERIWFSPHCLGGSVFDQVDGAL